MLMKTLGNHGRASQLIFKQNLRSGWWGRSDNPMLPKPMCTNYRISKFLNSKGASCNFIKRKLRQMMIQVHNSPKEPCRKGRPHITFYEIELDNKVPNSHVLLLIRVFMENLVCVDYMENFVCRLHGKK